jgi:hypothetical protein
MIKAVYICLMLPMAVSPCFGQSSNKKLTADDFTTSADCQRCHEQIHAQWASSQHSRSFSEPIYQTFLRRVSEKTKGKLNSFCLSCHAPLATVTNSVPENPLSAKNRSPLLNQGVSCEFCHTISGTEVQSPKLRLGAFLFPRMGQTETLFGRHADVNTEAHPTKPSQFLLSSELCGTCHRFAHPATGRYFQDTFEEWKRSPYAAQGTRCQDCHMPAYSGKVAPKGKERAELHAHVFLGGHSELIRKAATLNVSAQWVKLGRKEHLEVTIDVTNTGAGHLIPTGVPGIREMWLEVTVFNAEQAVATRKRVLGLELFDAQGKPDAMPWDAARLGRDTRIGPKQTRREKYTFTLKKAPAVRVEAKLLERLFSEQAARYAGIPAPAPLPMAEASLSTI